MKLEKFYSLRTEFAIIGLTGKVGSGCSEIAKKLSDPEFINNIQPRSNRLMSAAESLKNQICYNFLKTDDNWEKFNVINYKDVLLFHLLHQCNKESEGDDELALKCLIEIICQNGVSIKGKEKWENRIDKNEDAELLNILLAFLNDNISILDRERYFGCDDLNECLKDSEKLIDLYSFFFLDLVSFSNEFYRIINSYSVTKRTRLTHDLANNLRAYGNVRNNNISSIDNIYTIAETLNRLIKSWRKKMGSTKLIIDSLKNSLELMYFKEKYSGFYMIASNKSEACRAEYVRDRIVNNPDLENISIDKKTSYADQILALDEVEYKTSDYKKGRFSYPDIENCIQKSDFHIFIDKKSEDTNYLDIDYQLIRLIALIAQPGIITPTAIERSMQVAYNAKFNSGCISRQVGAVITDSSFSIKSIGWNDVPQGQTPCNLRNVTDLEESNTDHLFSDYEKSDEFKNFVISKLPENYQSNLGGRNCSICFKSFQNAMEGEKNQVHTRSLHAEENAMLQITKYGGQGLQSGNLFTTASPCELCSKKAYQLGIRNIYYIDPYPGIATKHTLKSGVNKESNPKLIMFQGAVGRLFHKLYEPFMAYKDEMAILTGIDPQPSVEVKIRNFVKNVELQNKLIERLKGKTQAQQEEFLERSLGISLEKTK